MFARSKKVKKGGGKGGDKDGGEGEDGEEGEEEDEEDEGEEGEGTCPMRVLFLSRCAMLDFPHSTRTGGRQDLSY